MNAKKTNSLGGKGIDRLRSSNCVHEAMYGKAKGTGRTGALVKRFFGGHLYTELVWKIGGVKTTARTGSAGEDVIF